MIQDQDPFERAERRRVEHWLKRMGLTVPEPQQPSRRAIAETPAAASTPTTPAITHDWAARISAEVSAQIGRELEVMDYVEVLRAIGEAINAFIERIGDLEKAEAEGKVFKAQIGDQLTTLADELKAAARNVADDNREILAKITARLDANELENKALLSPAGIRLDRWTGELRDQHIRCVSPSRHLRRAHSQGREACRLASHAVHQIRVRAQPEDRQGARPRSTRQAGRTRRRGDRMKRREFITLLGGAAAACPLRARAQQPAMPVIGFIGGDSSGLADRLNAFRTGLGETGYVEGRNAAIEYRLAEGKNERLPALMDDLLRLPAIVIAAGGLPAVLAAKATTTTVPIAFYVGVDPVEMGIVASLNRPGGNLTGVTGLSVELVPKRLELLHEMAPTATVVALLVNPTNPNAATQTRQVHAAARTLGLELHVLNASNERDFDAVFARVAGLQAGALVVGADGLFIRHGEQLGALTVRHRVPAIFQDRAFVAAGGLTSYGASIVDAYRLVGVYAGRLLKGEKPADLPVMQPTKYEFVINLKTAKALGIDVPAQLLARADEVIE
jgi:putative ABC transport system substrate-binding protein